LGVIYKKHRRQTMQEFITGFVGLDAHAESTAIAVAEVGREAPRFVGSVGARVSELTKALAKLGEPQRLHVVYEAGPCGYALARELVGGAAGNRDAALRRAVEHPSLPRRWRGL